jgi:hypothetical protein
MDAPLNRSRQRPLCWLLLVAAVTAAAVVGAASTPASAARPTPKP